MEQTCSLRAPLYQPSCTNKMKLGLSGVSSFSVGYLQVGNTISRKKRQVKYTQHKDRVTSLKRKATVKMGREGEQPIVNGSVKLRKGEGGKRIELQSLLLIRFVPFPPPSPLGVEEGEGRDSVEWPSIKSGYVSLVRLRSSRLTILYPLYPLSYLRIRDVICLKSRAPID